MGLALTNPTPLERLDQTAQNMERNYVTQDWRPNNVALEQSRFGDQSGSWSGRRISVSIISVISPEHTVESKETRQWYWLPQTGTSDSAGCSRRS